MIKSYYLYRKLTYACLIFHVQVRCESFCALFFLKGVSNKVWRRAVECHVIRVSFVEGSGLHRLSGWFSSARRPLLDTSLSRSVILWTVSVEPVSVDALPLSLLLSLLRWWIGFTAGAAIPNFSLLPTSGVYPQSVPSVCLSSNSPTLP